MVKTIDPAASVKKQKEKKNLSVDQRIAQGESLTASDTTDNRLKRSVDQGRADRAMEDRSVADDRQLNDPVGLSFNSDEFLHNKLPNVPAIPGYHLIWLSTTNQYDPIENRMRLGYVPVKSHEIPGFEYTTLRGGEWAGCIGCNEMILFKLPEQQYKRYMNQLHHQRPNQEEDKIRDMIEETKRAMGPNAKVTVHEGFNFNQKAVGRFD